MFEMYGVLSLLKYLFPSLRVCHSKFQLFRSMWFWISRF